MTARVIRLHRWFSPQAERTYADASSLERCYAIATEIHECHEKQWPLIGQITTAADELFRLRGEVNGLLKDFYAEHATAKQHLEIEAREPAPVVDLPVPPKPKRARKAPAKRKTTSRRARS